MTATATDIAVAHVNDDASIQSLVHYLRELHGPTYDFALRRWRGETRLTAPPGRVRHWFVVTADHARVVNGRAADLWPGDTITATAPSSVTLTGGGTAFEVSAEASAYAAPPVVHLRDLPDHPRGCAAYAGAFRRQPLPPVPSTDPLDRRGVNRVNQHTLDMRSDRSPGPTTHYHAPVSAGTGRAVNHSETAIVLPRAAYGLPETTDEPRAVIYRRPADDPRETVTVPLRPGSILVTPATSDAVMGHRFENAFAMLIAIPGFVTQTTQIA